MPRPLSYFRGGAWIHTLPHWPTLYHRSFPSGHSEGAFSFFCFLSLLLPVKYRPAGLVFAGLALAVCYSRVYLAAHFFEDIYIGSILGMVTTTLAYSLMTANKDNILKKIPLPAAGRKKRA